MLSGRRLDLLDPSPLDVEMEDIAHGLARVARWNGQTMGAHIFSVAQHCLLVETIARQRARLDRQGRLAVLLHDAPEYVIGDMISPFKAVIGDNYKAVEARLLAAIHIRFGLPATLSAELLALIKAADQGAAYLEATRLAGFTAAEAGRFFGKPPALSAAIAARLSDALAGRNRRSALSRAVCTTVPRLTLSRHHSRAYIGRHDSRLLALPSAPHRRGNRRPPRRDAAARRPSRAAPGEHRRRQPPHPRHGRHPGADRRLCRALRGARAEADRLRARLGPGDALVVHCYAGISRSTAGAFVDRLRAQSLRARSCSSRRSCASAPTPPRPTAASCRSPTTCSAATAAWSTRSRPSGPAPWPMRRPRSGSSWNSASSTAAFAH